MIFFARQYIKYELLIPFIRKLDRAGTHWRTHVRANDVEPEELDADTYRSWMGLAQKEERSKKRVTGLGVCMSLLYYLPGRIAFCASAV